MTFDFSPALGKIPAFTAADREIPNRYGKTRALFYESVDFRGRGTTVFAYLGIPDAPMPEGGFPAVVLAHGGGGCAFPEWVEYWNQKGYAAVAPDLSGKQFGSKAADAHTDTLADNPDGGPRGYGSFGTSPEDYRNSWTYHGVSALILANTLLRNLTEVNKEQIVLTGISWGGVLTCVTAGTDHRFRAFAPVYGCGFLDRIPGTRQPLASVSDRDGWLSCYDPIRYLGNCTRPILFTIGTNEPFFSISANADSARLCGGNAVFSYRGDLRHYHRWRDEEGMEVVSAFFADVLGGEPLPFSVSAVRDGGTVRISLDRPESVASCVFRYAAGIDGEGNPTDWRGEELLPAQETVIPLPAGATACFAECVSKGEHQIILSSPLIR